MKQDNTSKPLKILKKAGSSSWATTKYRIPRSARNHTLGDLWSKRVQGIRSGNWDHEQESVFKEVHKTMLPMYEAWDDRDFKEQLDDESRSLPRKMQKEYHETHEGYQPMSRQERADLAKRASEKLARLKPASPENPSAEQQPQPLSIVRAKP